MKHLLLLLPLFIFVACTSTFLHYQSNLITLQNQNSSLTFNGNTLDSFQQNLSQVSIRKHVFQDEMNEKLVYEYARLASGYKFKYNYRYILRHVFDARNVEVIKDENGLGFFTITQKDNNKFNAIVMTGTKKSLTMLYGFSEDNFKALMDGNALQRQKQKEVKSTELIRSRWNMKLIITGVLLQQEGGRPYIRK